MNKSKINKIIALATICCTMTNALPVLAFTGESQEIKESKELLIEGDFKISKSKESKSTVTFQDAGFEEFVREALSVENDEPIEQSTLEKYAGVSIDIEKYNIQSLQDITLFVNLRDLTISNNSTVSLEPINGLNSLETLTLNTGAYNLNGIAEDKVKNLNLHGAETDLNTINNFINLEKLKISDLPKTLNYDFLDTLKNKESLKNLEINDSRNINDFADKISAMSHITNLKIAASGIHKLDLKFLEGTSQLESLDLFNADSSNIATLNELKNLTNLKINSSSITNDDLREIQETIGRVKSLGLSNNLITSVEPFSGYSDDFELNLNRNYINLENKDNVAFLNKRSEVDMYPQKKLISTKDDNVFLIKTGTELDIDFLKTRYIDKDGTITDYSVADDEIEYTILPGNGEPNIQISNNNKIEAIRDGIGRVHINVNGVASSSTTVTVNVGSAEQINDKGSVLIKFKNENGDAIGEQESLRMYSEGKNTVITPHIKNYEISGDTIYSDVNVEAGKTKTIEFTYRMKPEDKTNYGRIQVIYLDENGEKIIEDKTIRDLELTTHTINSEDIEGYTLVSDNSEEVILTETQPYNLVNFKYRKNNQDNNNTDDVEAKGTIKVNYVDKATNEKITTSDIKEDLELKSHEVQAKNIDGYEVDGSNTKNVVLTKDSPNKEVTFYYNKIKDDVGNVDDVKAGTVTIKYVERDTGLEIANQQVIKDVELGNQTFEGKNIEGFTCVTEDITINLTEENPSAIITFEYAPFVEGDDYAVFTLTPALMNKYVEDEYIWSMSAYNKSITFNPTLLKAISNKMTENFSIKFNQSPFNEKGIESAKKKYKLDVIDTISLEMNAPDINTKEKVTLNAIIEKNTDKKVFLYKLNNDNSITKVAESAPVSMVDNNDDKTIVTFDVDLKDINKTDYIISSTDVKNTTNNDSNKEEDKKEEDKNKLPDTSGSASALAILSITSILAGIKTRKKHK